MYDYIIYFLVTLFFSTFFALGGVGRAIALVTIFPMLGFDAKKTAYIVSFIIPFSSFGAFITYLQFVQMDWTLLDIVTIAVLLGGYIGGKIMHFKLSQVQIKKTNVQSN